MLATCILLGLLAASLLVARPGQVKLLEGELETTTAPQQDRDESHYISAMGEVQVKEKDGVDEKPGNDEKKLETAYFGAGCFWCVEAVFEELKGVQSVDSGFMGGTVKNPTYDQVCDGATGHAEICRIKFDPAVISFEQLLEVFWKTHDPTTLNRQGADFGTQYRSAVFYTNEEQQKLATKYKKRLDDSGAFDGPIVTEIAAASDFYPAGDYHTDYYRRNPDAGYCRNVIRPKLDKFRKAFADNLRVK
jgi:peptide-methionine (S)-S-oxide reductase